MSWFAFISVQSKRNINKLQADATGLGQWWRSSWSHKSATLPQRIYVELTLLFVQWPGSFYDDRVMMLRPIPKIISFSFWHSDCIISLIEWAIPWHIFVKYLCMEDQNSIFLKLCLPMTVHFFSIWNGLLGAGGEDFGFRTSSQIGPEPDKWVFIQILQARHIDTMCSSKYTHCFVKCC